MEALLNSKPQNIVIIWLQLTYHFYRKNSYWTRWYWSQKGFWPQSHATGAFHSQRCPSCPHTCVFCEEGTSVWGWCSVLSGSEQITNKICGFIFYTTNNVWKLFFQTLVICHFKLLPVTWHGYWLLLGIFKVYCK